MKKGDTGSYVSGASHGYSDGSYYGQIGAIQHQHEKAMAKQRADAAAFRAGNKSKSRRSASYAKSSGSSANVTFKGIVAVFVLSVAGILFLIDWVPKAIADGSAYAIAYQVGAFCSYFLSIGAAFFTAKLVIFRTKLWLVLFGAALAAAGAIFGFQGFLRPQTPLLTAMYFLPHISAALAAVGYRLWPRWTIFGDPDRMPSWGVVIFPVALLFVIVPVYLVLAAVSAVWPEAAIARDISPYFLWVLMWTFGVLALIGL